jgi:hypothetical protein
MAITLLEAQKLNPGDALRDVVTEMYVGSSDILATLPFDDINGNALKYNRESKLPGIGFRGVNEGYTPTHGILNPIVESLVIAGGDLDVDKFIIDTMGSKQRAIQEQMQIRSLSWGWTKKFIKGDISTNARELDGLQSRITGAQKIQAGATANGTALSLAVLDAAIDQTLNPTHIIMNKKMKRRLAAAARTTTVGGYVTYDTNQLGAQITQYNGLPILTVDLDEEGNEILGFNEAATSGTATATSIYVVSFGDGALVGLQNGGISVRDLGELQDEPKFRTRVEWYTGMAIYNGRAATRLWSIADAAITA